MTATECKSIFSSIRITVLGFVVVLSVLGNAIAAKKTPEPAVVVPVDETKTPEKQQPKNDADQDTPKAIPDDAIPTIEKSIQLDEDSTVEDDDAPAQKTRTEEQHPPVLRDISKLPAPVRRMRELILEAAKKGNIEELRSLLGIGETATTISIGGLEGDPIKFLKETSGDDEGFEILAILIEVLEAGFVHLDAGNEEEIYIWPYFFAWPIEKMSPSMKVELFRVLTAGDVEDSRDSGGYIFYRVGIKPDGTWSFFVAGD